MIEPIIDSLIKIYLNPVTNKLTANWSELPSGAWTNDMSWLGNPEDEELAALAILAHRNLEKRVADQPRSCVKIWGVGEGFKVTLAYNDDQSPAERAGEIGNIAVLLSTQPIPREK